MPKSRPTASRESVKEREIVPPPGRSSERFAAWMTLVGAILGALIAAAVTPYVTAKYAMQQARFEEHRELRHIRIEIAARTAGIFAGWTSAKKDHLFAKFATEEGKRTKPTGEDAVSILREVTEASKQVDVLKRDIIEVLSLSSLYFDLPVKQAAHDLNKALTEADSFWDVSPDFIQRLLDAQGRLILREYGDDVADHESAPWVVESPAPPRVERK